VEEWLVNNKSVGKGAVRTRLEVICLEELRKTAQNSQDSRYLRQDLKQGLQEYKAEATSTRVRKGKMEIIKKRKIRGRNKGDK